MINIIDVYEAMQDAATKAKLFQEAYAKALYDAHQDARHILRHQLAENRTPKTYAFTLKQTKENDMALQDAGSSYAHWRDEQIRLSSLLQGEAAFKELTKTNV